MEVDKDQTDVSPGRHGFREDTIQRGFVKHGDPVNPVNQSTNQSGRQVQNRPSLPDRVIRLALEDESSFRR